MTDEINVHIEESEDGDAICLRVTEPREFHDFNGDTVEKPIEVADIRLPSDPEIAQEVAGKLWKWYADNQGAGPPGQKPMHQQIEEANR